MSAPVNIHEAKTRFSKLVERAEAGEEIVIARAGKPAARLVPLERHQGERELGLWRGRVRVHRDFDELPDELAAAFRGERP